MNAIINRLIELSVGRAATIQTARSIACAVAMVGLPAVLADIASAQSTGRSGQVFEQTVRQSEPALSPPIIHDIDGGSVAGSPPDAWLPQGPITHLTIGNRHAMRPGVDGFIDPMFAPAAGRGVTQTVTDPSLASDPSSRKKRRLHRQIDELLTPAGNPKFPIPQAKKQLNDQWRHRRGSLRAAAVTPVYKTPYSYGYFGSSARRQWHDHQTYRDRSTHWRYE